eukprot:4071984-Pleurochrysis_carterae.AAC.1
MRGRLAARTISARGFKCRALYLHVCDARLPVATLKTRRPRCRPSLSSAPRCCRVRCARALSDRAGQHVSSADKSVALSRARRPP